MTILETTKAPVVSCIMPTFNRRRFITQAINYFLCQDYIQKELIVVDDGTDAVKDLIPGNDCIRYIRLEEKMTVGAKRNLACEMAKGDIIVHWDDDDWMADWRLSYQVENIGNADMCGLNRVLFFDPAQAKAWEYVYPGTTKPWIHGATLCYRKSFWHENHFPNRDVGEDLHFVWNDPDAKIIAHNDNRFMVALVHPGNVSVKKTCDDCWFALSFSEIKELIGKSWAFYEVAKPDSAGW